MGIDKYFWPQSTAVNISCFGYPTEETCDKFMFFVENQREKREGEKRKKKCLERSSSAESYFLSIELVVRRLELM